MGSNQSDNGNHSQATRHDETRKAPVKTISCGNVMLSIFRNQAQRGPDATYYTVKVSRSYRDPEGSWNYASSLYKSQLPQLVYVCHKALEFIEDAESEPPF